MDFMPDGLRAKLNGGIGGYVSQRKLCQRLRANAPRDDAELLPLLYDLMVVSSPALLERLQRDLDGLTLGLKVCKEFFENGISLGFFHGEVKRRFDDTNIYRVVYADGDIEDYTIEELLPILDVAYSWRDLVKNAHEDLVSVIECGKNNPESQKYFFREKLMGKSKEWFGKTLVERRKLSVSLFNFCIFQHPVGSCTCDNGVDPWAPATTDKPCVFRHDPDECKCAQIAIKLSQDECAYAAYLLQKKEWRVGGKVSLRKKTDGPPIMVSKYVSFEFGAGIKVNRDMLHEINRLRSCHNNAAAVRVYYEELSAAGKRVQKRPLSYYPESDDITVHVMQPGQNKDGIECMNGQLGVCVGRWVYAWLHYNLFMP